MARRSPPRKVTYFEPVAPRLARNTIIESTFEVARRFRCTMRIDCGQLDPGAVIRPDPGEWHPRMPERLDEEELADYRPQRGLSVRRPDRRRAPRGRGRMSRASGRCSTGEPAATERPLCEKKTPAGGGRGFHGDERGGELESKPFFLRMTMSESGQLNAAPSGILMPWNLITKPAIKRYRPVMRGSTDGCLPPSARRGFIADRSARRVRQNGRT